MTDAELSKALEVEAERDQLRIEVACLKSEITALRDEIELWMDRCAAEQQAHNATIAEIAAYQELKEFKS